MIRFINFQHNIYLCALILLAFTGCKKEISTFSVLPSNPITLDRSEGFDPLNTTKISVWNGVVRFQDYQTYKDFRNFISIVYDSVYIESLHSNYPQYFELVDGVIVDEEATPFYRILESILGHESLRQYENNQLESFLLNGGDPAEFAFHFVKVPSMKSYMNIHAEYMIGDLIYKQLDQNRTAIITNADFQSLQLLRETPLEDVKSSVNLYIFNPLFDNFDYDLFYEMDINGEIQTTLSGSCKARFEVSAVTPTSIELRNLSMLPNPPATNYTFTWNINGVDYNTVGLANLTYVNTNNQWPLEIKLTVAGPNCTDVSQPQIFENPCSAISFTAATTNGYDFTFTPNILGYTYTWDFGDGMIVTTSASSIQHQYPKLYSKSYPVKLTITAPSCSASYSAPVTQSCGTANASFSWSSTTSSNGKLRVDGWGGAFKDYSHNVTYFQVDARSYRKSGNIWFWKKVTSIYCSLGGIYFPNCGGTIPSSERYAKFA